MSRFEISKPKLPAVWHEPSKLELRSYRSAYLGTILRLAPTNYTAIVSLTCGLRVKIWEPWSAPRKDVKVLRGLKSQMARLGNKRKSYGRNRGLWQPVSLETAHTRLNFTEEWNPKELKPYNILKFKLQSLRVRDLCCTIEVFWTIEFEDSKRGYGTIGAGPHVETNSSLAAQIVHSWHP